MQPKVMTVKSYMNDHGMTPAVASCLLFFLLTENRCISIEIHLNLYLYYYIIILLIGVITSTDSQYTNYLPTSSHQWGEGYSHRSGEAHCCMACGRQVLWTIYPELIFEERDCE